MKVINIIHVFIQCCLIPTWKYILDPTNILKMRIRGPNIIRNTGSTIAPMLAVPIP